MSGHRIGPSAKGGSLSICRAQGMQVRLQAALPTIQTGHAKDEHLYES